MSVKSGAKPNANERTLIGVSPAPGRVVGAASGVPSHVGTDARRELGAVSKTASNDRTLLGVARVSRPIPASVTNVAGLEPGAIVADHYVLGEPVQEGGMATIWAATDRATGRAVIVKTIHLHLSENEEVIRRFQQEADIIAAVRSPHVVELLDRGVLAGSPFLVLERLEGEDLEERLAGRRLSVAECVTLLDQVALALMPAHGAGVVHRDLKPANIYLARSGDGEVVKLLDFGIAKLRESTLALTAAGQTVGTPEYMSPEQLEGKDLDGRSDLFAMAAVLYTALTGKAPFDADGLAETFERIKAGDLVLPSRAARDVPRRIDAFFQRALAFDRDARYADASAMAAAFRAFAVDDAPELEVSATRDSTEPRTSDVMAAPTPAPPLEPQPTSRSAPQPLPVPRADVAATSPQRAKTAEVARPSGSSTTLWIVAGVVIVGLVAAAVAFAMSSSDASAPDGRERARSRTEHVPAAAPTAAPTVTTTPTVAPATRDR